MNTQLKTTTTFDPDILQTVHRAKIKLEQSPDQTAPGRPRIFTADLTEPLILEIKTYSRRELSLNLVLSPDKSSPLSLSEHKNLKQG